MTAVDSESVRTIALALLGIVALLLLLAAGLKRWRWQGMAAANPLTVAAASHLGPRERLVMVRVRDRELLLGVSAAGIVKLADFPAPEDDDSVERSAGGAVDFLSLLQRARGQTS
ncbi:MAG: flagellar biosynthetic protein FliO [Pseudomonadota bacterium]